MSKRRKPTTPAGPGDLLAAPAAHAHGPNCTHCGTTMQRTAEASYEINDRMLQMLVLAIAKQQGLRAECKGSGAAARVVVEAPDRATLDQLDVRVRDLCAKLDEELIAVTRAFVRTHTGMELGSPRRA
jgi:hypothetical protein